LFCEFIRIKEPLSLNIGVSQNFEKDTSSTLVFFTEFKHQGKNVQHCSGILREPLLLKLEIEVLNLIYHYKTLAPCSWICTQQQKTYLDYGLSTILYSSLDISFDIES
jgi:hypothetical protein